MLRLRDRGLEPEQNKELLVTELTILHVTYFSFGESNGCK
jgi:hypothetical protein